MSSHNFGAKETALQKSPEDRPVFGGFSVAVLGLGNILLRDEGIGVRAVEALRERFQFPETVTLIDGGTMGLDLLPFIEGMEKVLIVDAADMKKAPGTIAIIEDDEIPSFVSTKLSIHQISFPDVVFAARLMGISPAKMSLIGIQPESLEPGLELSENIQMNFERLLETVTEKLREWGVELREKPETPPAALSTARLGG